jgi:hypothetical protein
MTPPGKKPVFEGPITILAGKETEAMVSLAEYLTGLPGFLTVGLASRMKGEGQTFDSWYLIVYYTKKTMELKEQVPKTWKKLEVEMKKRTKPL